MSPELDYLHVKWAAHLPYPAATKFLKEILPLDHAISTSGAKIVYVLSDWNSMTKWSVPFGMNLESYTIPPSWSLATLQSNELVIATQ